MTAPLVIARRRSRRRNDVSGHGWTPRLEARAKPTCPARLPNSLPPPKFHPPPNISTDRTPVPAQPDLTGAPGPRCLTKHEFLTGLRCHKALWWMVHEPLSPELVPDRSARARMEMGRDVGVEARTRVPGGVQIGPAYQGIAARVEATRQAMSDGAPVIYEATFHYGDLAVSADILVRERSGWVLVEVKGATTAKAEYVADAAYQAWVAQSAGAEIVGVEVMHLNAECQHPDLETLFVRDDVTGAALVRTAEFEQEAAEMFAMLDRALPERTIGRHCIDPHDCPFKGRCWPEFPKHHVSTVYFGRTAWFGWVRDGYHTIHDLPEVFKVPRGGKPAARQIRAVREGRMIVEEGLAKALDGFRGPLAFLDFETVQPAIPVWRGCKPLEQVAVQFSCHTEDGAGGHRHYQWLADGPDDRRAEMAARMIEACTGAGAVVAYNMAFERGCIERLAEVFPEQADALLDIAARLVDLLPVVRDHVYHPEFGGGFGLKKVLGPLLGERTHANLGISEGETASLELTRLLFHGDAVGAQERAVLREQLLAYCKADTWEMVRLLRALRALAQSPGMPG